LENFTGILSYCRAPGNNGEHQELLRGQRKGPLGNFNYQFASIRHGIARIDDQVHDNLLNFYRSGDAVVSVPVETEPAFKPGQSKTLFRGERLYCAEFRDGIGFFSSIAR